MPKNLKELKLRVQRLVVVFPLDHKLMLKREKLSLKVLEQKKLAKLKCYIG